MKKDRDKILIVINVDWFFLLHRVPIALALKKEFEDVYILGKDTGKGSDIQKLGFKFINIDFDRKSLNPIKEINALFQLYKIFRQLKPNVIYNITIKPIIYSLFISKFLKIKSVNTICGLGYVFSDSKKNMLKYFIIQIYRFTYLNTKSHTFFENKDDLELFLKYKILKKNSIHHLVRGTGVDLKKFSCNFKGDNKQGINIVLPARMLWSKGIKEFVEAAKLLKEKYEYNVFFKLYGDIDKGNREAIPEEYLRKIEIKNYLKWFGFYDDMVRVYRNSDIVVLPSYYKEGLPVSLMEACAMGKPIITTDSVGCKDCVDEGINGYIVPVKSITELAKAMEELILSYQDRLTMGKNSRIKAEKEFDQRRILKEYMKVFISIKNE